MYLPEDPIEAAQQVAKTLQRLWQALHPHRARLERLSEKLSGPAGALTADEVTLAIGCVNTVVAELKLREDAAAPSGILN